MAPPLSKRLFCDVMNEVMRPWLRQQGVPHEVLLVPPHLVHYKGHYRNHELWPHMYILSHDEKDMKRMKGSLQDWGDGEAQAAYAAKGQALHDLAKILADLRSLNQQSTPSAADFMRAKSLLQGSHAETLKEYCVMATVLVVRHDEHGQRLQRRQARLGAAKAEQSARLGKHIEFLNAQVAEIQQLLRHSAGLSASVAALPAAPMAHSTVAELASLVSDMRKLIEYGFDLAHVAASKALAMCFSSVFDMSPNAVGALYFTSDDAKTWQMREAVLRTMREHYAEHGMIPVMVAADKAYTGTRGQQQMLAFWLSMPRCNGTWNRCSGHHRRRRASRDTRVC